MQQGGMDQLGFIMNAHILVHYVPGYVILAFLIFERNLIGKTISAFFLYQKYPDILITIYNALYVFLVTVLSVAFPFILYSLIFNPREIYGFDISYGLLILIAIVVIILFNIIPYLVMLENYVFKPEIEKFDKRRREYFQNRH